jgi:hypothetical protein
MTIEELRKKLREIADYKGFDPELTDVKDNHMKADCFLLQFINDIEVSEAFHAIEKWYA